MAAATEIRADDFYKDGTEGREHGEVIVLRVVQFLAETVGIDLRDYGGRWFLPNNYREALTGNVADAARRLNGVDDAESQRRRAEYDAGIEVQIIRARHAVAIGKA